MLDPLKPLLLALLGLGVVLGLVSKQQVLRTIGRMIFFPVLLAVILTYGKQIWIHMDSFSQMAVAVAILLAGIVFLLKIVLGKELFTDVLGNFIYDVLKTVVLFPFRLIKRIIQSRRY